MKLILRTSLVAAALVATAAARAAQPVSLLVPVTYEYSTSVLHKTKETCKLESNLETGIGSEIEKRAGRPGTVSTTAGVVLRVTIVGSGGIGGGGWTGAKSLAVRVEELQDGQVVRMRTFANHGRNGLLGAFEGTCGILEGLSGKLSKDIVDWTGTQTDAAFDVDAEKVALAHQQAQAQNEAQPQGDAASSARP